MFHAVQVAFKVVQLAVKAIPVPDATVYIWTPAEAQHVVVCSGPQAASTHTPLQRQDQAGADMANKSSTGMLPTSVWATVT